MEQRLQAKKLKLLQKVQKQQSLQLQQKKALPSMVGMMLIPNGILLTQVLLKM